MPREIFIVARDRPDLYRYLSQTFSDAENVQVIWDRRGADRRATSNPHIVAGRPLERRPAERRPRPSVEHELRSVGYAFLSITQPPAGTRGLRQAAPRAWRSIRGRSPRGAH